MYDQSNPKRCLPVKTQNPTWNGPCSACAQEKPLRRDFLRDEKVGQIAVTSNGASDFTRKMAESCEPYQCEPSAAIDDLSLFMHKQMHF